MKPALALLTLLLLAACGSADAPAPVLYCPNVAVLAQANTLNLFLPGRQDAGALVTQAGITGVSGACTLVKKRTILRVTFQAGFSATNGPANQSASLALPYFVSISQGDTILSKQNYSIPVSFDGNVAAAAATSKPVTVELPNTPDNAGTEILIGFQLTPDQLAYAAAHPHGQ